jgi:hypothetical protein
MFLLASSAWLLVQEDWVAGVFFFISGLSFVIGGMADVARRDMDDLGVPAGAKPAKIVRWSPPGSAWRHAADRAVRLHRTSRLVGLVSAIVGFAVFASHK